VPLVGINQGRLGFMTDIALDDMLDGITALLEGRFSREQSVSARRRGAARRRAGIPDRR
jgi:NAD kinase